MIDCLYYINELKYFPLCSRFDIYFFVEKNVANDFVRQERAPSSCRRFFSDSFWQKPKSHVTSLGNDDLLDTDHTTGYVHPALYRPNRL